MSEQNWRAIAEAAEADYRRTKRERDEARAEVERLRVTLVEVGYDASEFGHDFVWQRARAEQAEAAIARVRALCERAERNYGGDARMANMEAWVHLGSLRAALEGDA